MGLTKQSTGHAVADADIHKKASESKIIALAGNPNVGKSTVFNALTGMHQHTGNWPGKTVGNAWGTLTIDKKIYTLVDIPGTYSLSSHSHEEEIARNFLCFNEPDAIVIVCDATCLQRNLNLVLQTLEISNNVIVCVNLMDEAERKHISVNCQKLSEHLGVPVIPTSAKQGKGLTELTESISKIVHTQALPTEPCYRPEIEEALSLITPEIRKLTQRLNPRWVALKLLDTEESLLSAIDNYLGLSLKESRAVCDGVLNAKAYLSSKGYDSDRLRDSIVSDLYQNAEAICADVITHKNSKLPHQLKADRFLTSKATGIPVMLLMLLAILWLTITGANYPSAMLTSFLFSLEEPLFDFLTLLQLPDWLQNSLIFGGYRVLAWVVSVMLPPMAIFFPLFTLLEDLGYLPRVAFNLDHAFKKCRTCGKQALTMCMGFGCNAAGVVGCRIIDSPRERLIAILTNSFVPCNGRFPTLIAIITMFFAAGLLSSVVSAVFLTGLIVASVLMTLFISRLLSETCLKGLPSSFALELPPYRRPQIGKVLIRSVFDRTLFVLGRAAAVAAPAGLAIYALSNITYEGISLLSHGVMLLDPFARLLGLDGVLLMAFILGFPANEIVMPIAIMAYLSQGTLTELNDLTFLRSLLIDNGWTWLTAVCTMIFSLFHWPCSTTFLSIKKETGSWRWAALGFLLPTAVGMLLCFLLSSIVRMIALF